VERACFLLPSAQFFLSDRFFPFFFPFADGRQSGALLCHCRWFREVGKILFFLLRDLSDYRLFFFFFSFFSPPRGKGDGEHIFFPLFPSEVAQPLGAPPAIDAP